MKSLKLQIKKQDLSVFLIYSLLLFGLYFSAIKWMVRGWEKDDYSYCYLVPFVIIYLLWEKRKALQEIPSSPTWMGFISIAFGLFLFWVGELGGEFFTLYMSLWFVIVGIVWLHLGWQKLKTIAFSLFLILSLFPFPQFIYNKISLKLQLISSQLGVLLLHLYGMSAFREGNVIDIGFTQLQVVEACSGLRYLISLVILSVLLAYFFKDRLWKRTILVISSIPIAIVMNALRIAITGILYEKWGARVAEGFFHGFSGWLIFLVALAIMLVEMRILKALWPISGTAPEIGANSDIASSDDPSKETKGVNQSRSISHLRLPQFVVAIILFLVTFGVSSGVEFREKIPIRKPLSEFPLKLAGYEGKRDFMEQRFIDALDFTDYVIIDYKDERGREINFYVAYYESQRKGESIHSPETCLPGSGWEFHGAGVKVLKLGGKEVRINRAFMVKPGARELVYFFFPQRGRILTTAYELKLYNFIDALTKRRTDGALVRIITPVYPDEDLKGAEERLTKFTERIFPILSQFLPG